MSDYAKMPTRQLLAEFERLRRMHSYICNDGWLPDSADDEFRMLEEMEAMKAVLATREHVPNVPEARAIRQQKAREKKNRGRQD